MSNTIDLLLLDAATESHDHSEFDDANILRIAEHYGRTDLAAIEAEYEEGTHDDFLWPAREDEQEFQVWFGEALAEAASFAAGGGTLVEPDGPDIEFHPVTEVCPSMSPEEYDSLVKSIRENGLANPIWLHPDDRSIVDGRHRYRACKELGARPRFQLWSGKGSLLAFVVSQNLERRHLTTGQKAIAGQRMKQFIQEEVANGKAGKNRQQALARSRDEAGRLLEGQVRPDSDEPGQRWDVTAGKIVGVGSSSISLADQLQQQAPDLYQRVWDGLATLNLAQNELKKRKRAEFVADQFELFPNPVQGPEVEYVRRFLGAQEAKPPAMEETDRLEALILRGCRYIMQAGDDPRFGELKAGPLAKMHARRSIEILTRAAGERTSEAESDVEKVRPGA